MIVEWRTYHVKPGLRDRFLLLFRALSIPEHARLGMPITGPFPLRDDPDNFAFARAFLDEAAREKLIAQFYGGTLWRDELEPALMPMLARYDVVVLDDPDGHFGPPARETYDS